MASKPKSPSILFLSFFIPILYWLYLFFTTETQVIWDSLDYQNLGRLLQEHGWIEYFKTGPNREPLYPLFISVAMRLADLGHISYLKILVGLQFLCLLTTQILTLKILRKLKTAEPIVALVIFYLGVSPALINTALSLYSEILFLPFIPLAILVLNRSQQKTNADSYFAIVAQGFLLGLTFLLMTLIKGVFEVLTLFLILSPLLLLQKTNFRRYLILSLTALIVFQAGLFGYKSLNKKYNGVFTLTNRGAWALYGYAARRTEAFTPEHWLSALAWIPGEGACTTLLGEAKCRYWGTTTSDSFGMEKLKELEKQGLTGEAADQKMLELTKARIRAKPLQYATLVGLESLKIFFWESTRLAFVTYPSWLEKIFDNGIIKNGLRLMMAIIAFAGSFFMLWILWRERNKKTEAYTLIYLMVVFIFFYTGIYSIFWLSTRYALPLAPLFLIAAAAISLRIKSSR